MTQLERLKRRIPEEPDDGVLEDVLESAKNVILSHRFPFQKWPTETIENEYGNLEEITVLEPRYKDLQIRIAIAIYNKTGGDYETSHSENGVTRVFGSEGVPQELLNEITPLVGIIN